MRHSVAVLPPYGTYRYCTYGTYFRTGDVMIKVWIGLASRTSLRTVGADLGRQL